MAFFNMFSRLPYWGALLCLLLSTAAAAQPQSIRLVTQHFPPFSYIEQNEVDGPARALIDRVCEAIKQSCRHQLLPWERAQKLVQLGRADGMYVIGANAERDGWVDYSVPLLRTEYGFFVRGDDPLHKLDAESLGGYRVGALAASNTLNSLRTLQQQGLGFEIVELTDSATAFRMLDAGRLDAVYSNREVGRVLIRQSGYRQLHYALAHRQLDYFVGFNAAQLPPGWVERFNKALLELQRQGVHRAILKAYGLE